MYNSSIYTLPLHGVSIPDHYFTVQKILLFVIFLLLEISPTIIEITKKEKSTEVKYSSDLIEHLANLNFNQFKEIVRNRSLLRDLPFNINNIVQKNCFTSSMWYYPGQVCHKNYLSLKKHEYESFRKSFLQINFKSNKARKVRDVYHDLALPDIDSEEFIEGFSVR